MMVGLSIYLLSRNVFFHFIKVTRQIDMGGGRIYLFNTVFEVSNQQ